MTSDELKEIRERVEKATPGPWWVWADDRGYMSVCRTEGKPLQVPMGCQSVEVRRADAELMAQSRQDIPKLLSHIQEQADEIERYKPAVQEVVNLTLRIGQFKEAADRYVKAHALSGVRFQDADLAGEYREAEKALLAVISAYDSELESSKVNLEKEVFKAGFKAGFDAGLREGKPGETNEDSRS